MKYKLCFYRKYSVKALSIVKDLQVLIYQEALTNHMILIMTQLIQSILQLTRLN